MGSLTPLPLPSGSFAPLTPGAVSVKPFEEASWRVSGILAGQNATAVLERGEESRIVRRGHRLPDGTVVVGISSSCVVLKHGDKKIYLNIGL